MQGRKVMSRWLISPGTNGIYGTSGVSDAFRFSIFISMPAYICMYMYILVDGVVWSISLSLSAAPLFSSPFSRHAFFNEISLSLSLLFTTWRVAGFICEAVLDILSGLNWSRLHCGGRGNVADSEFPTTGATSPTHVCLTDSEALARSTEVGKTGSRRLSSGGFLAVSRTRTLESGASFHDMEWSTIWC